MWKCFGYTEKVEDLDWQAITNKFEWIRDMIGVPQDPVFHAEGDVWTHTRMVTEEVISHPDFLKLDLQTRHIMFTSALLHDVEKRSTTQEEFNEELGRIQIVAPSHAKKGEYTARQVLYRDLDCPFDVREKICRIVRYHGLPIFAIEKDNPQKSVIQTSLYGINHLLRIFSECDMRGRVCGDFESQMYRIELFEELCKENNCFDKPYEFESDLSRFIFFKKSQSSPDYVPFNNIEMTVHLMCGIPASGKDHFIKNNLPDLPMISLDDIREELGFKAGTGTGQAIQEAKERAKQYLRVGQDFVWNGTNITRETRMQLIDLFTSYKIHPARVVIQYVETASNQQVVQNKDRKAVVPSKIIAKFVRNLEVPDLSEAHQLNYNLNYGSN
jgi:predicted kinase